MIKVSIIFFILLLISSTAIVKNSTKRIHEEIFLLEETIRDLEKDFENIKLEYEYLSSAERLKNFRNSYFEDELIQKDINNIKIIDREFDQIRVDTK